MQTEEGGRKARDTNKAKYGEDYYSKIGKLGADKYIELQKEGIAKPRGFAVMDKDKLRAVSIQGGRIGRRTK